VTLHRSLVVFYQKLCTTFTVFCTLYCNSVWWWPSRIKYGCNCFQQAYCFPSGWAECLRFGQRLTLCTLNKQLPIYLLATITALIGWLVELTDISTEVVCCLMLMLPIRLKRTSVVPNSSNSSWSLHQAVTLQLALISWPVIISSVNLLSYMLVRLSVCHLKSVDTKISLSFF